MSSLSEEEENYVRMSLLLTGLSPRAVRALFYKEFPTTSLQSTLNQTFIKNKLLSLQKERVINQAQWDLLYPSGSGVADSKTFDVTLMICLIRNLTSPGADLARIKYYRNHLAHLDDNKINNSDFNTEWNNISYAVQRLGGSSMYKECKDLKIKILDRSNQEIMLEIKNSQQEIKDLKTSFQNLKRSHDCLQDNMTQEVKKYKTSHEKLKRSCKRNAQQTEKLKTTHEQTTDEIKELKHGHQESSKEIEMLKDTVPWNIREQMTAKLEKWMEEDQLFVETGAAKHVMNCIKTNSCVTVTGSSGVGKTFTVRHVALQMTGDGYDILHVTNPEDVVRFSNPNKKTLFVIDDLCGTYTLNQTYLDKWKAMHEDIKGLLKNDGTQIIASCRLQVYQDEQFELLPLFTACECNLLLQNMSLSDEEKQLIAEKYLKSDASKISQYIDLFDFFPLLCRLYHENQTLNVVDLFKNPFSVYEEEIEKLKTEKAYGKYCALALCVMFNNHLKEEWLTEDVNQDIKQIIKNTCEACRLNRSTSRQVLQDELDSLIHAFLKKEQGCYRTIHDKLFDFLSFYFGKTSMISLIIKNGDKQLISERLVFEKKAGSDQLTTIVPDKYQKMYIRRMLDDWSKGEVVIVFTNNNMKIPEFRNMFLVYLKNLDITHQKQLATKCDNAAYTFECDNAGNVSLKTLDITDYSSRIYTPLQHCCAVGDIHMVEWCCSCGADVNYCGNDGETPLFIACKGGYTDIVTKLVDNKADINTCTVWGESALYIACEEGYTDIVTKLMDNKADINMCTVWGESPLYIACQLGYEDIVTKLVDNKAEINTCEDYKRSPLYIACEGEYTDIVAKLVDNKADINKCTVWKESPLYIACKKGYTDIVTKLMDNKADINMCLFWEESPLYKACELGYTDIVTKLVDNKADINKCTQCGESPLYKACEGGYTDIVTKLVDNKADINKCTQWGESPLYIACKGGYTDIVTRLVDNKADINKCTWKGESPLYIACKGGYTDIVTKLMDNKADINQCTWYGKSPLYIACEQGFIQIVKILIKKGANYKMCDKKGHSPLDIASGHDNIVEFITQNSLSDNL